MTRYMEEMGKEIYTVGEESFRVTELNKTHRKIRKPRMKGRASVNVSLESCNWRNTVALESLKFGRIDDLDLQQHLWALGRGIIRVVRKLPRLI